MSDNASYDIAFGPRVMSKEPKIVWDKVIDGARYRIVIIYPNREKGIRHIEKCKDKASLGEPIWQRIEAKDLPDVFMDDFCIAYTKDTNVFNPKQ